MPICNHIRTGILTALATAALWGLPRIVDATRIADITRLDGQREDTLTGMGLVIGLNGTGDGGKFQPAVRSLGQMMSNFGIDASPAELSDADNVAIVAITATVPVNGVRSGDKLDVHITSVGAARSLKGGRLFTTPMTGPLPGGGGLFALAEGAVVIEDDTNPTAGRVEGGCSMNQDLMRTNVRNGEIVLILDDAHATWTTANTIATIINQYEGIDGEEWAVAVNPKNVVVTIPPAELARPAAFIDRVQRLPVPLLADEARVRINERLGTIIITGDVEISPVVIRKEGLTITAGIANDSGVIGPGGADPFAATGRPGTRTTAFVPVGTNTTGPQRAKLRDLVDALDALQVPADDCIAILKELHDAGKLHAKLSVE